MANNKPKKKNKSKHNKKPKKQIKDNYSFKEMDMTVNGTKEMQLMYEIAKQFGFSNSGIDEAFQNFEDISKKYKPIKHIPSRFNHFFAQKGWIAYESLNFPLMERCVKLAEDGKPDEAEEALVEYFNDRKTVGFLVTRLIHLQEFRPRRTLMLNAIEDHFSGRYHASVPLFLMLIDGLVNDIERIGFFAEKVDLKVWDTIAAHDSGLNAIAKILGKSRKKTTYEEITLPYRNGILHGRDLGYANVKVSAKALSTLLALRDWADAIKKGKKGVDKEYVPPTPEESAEQLEKGLEGLQEIKRQQEFQDAWKPREITVGKDIPVKGDISEYGEDTPEKAVMEFLTYLTANNYGKLARIIEYNRNYNTVGKMAGKLRELFAGLKLIDYKLVTVNDNASAISVIETVLEFERGDGKQVSDNRTFRLIYQDEEGNTVTRGYKKAEWKIMLNFHDIELLNIMRVGD